MASELFPLVIFKNNNGAASIFVNSNPHFLHPAAAAWHLCLPGGISNLQNRGHPGIQGALMGGGSTKCLDKPFHGQRMPPAAML